MTPEEIRTMSKQINDLCSGLPPDQQLNIALPAMIGYASYAVTMLGEAAAALAEQNQVLRVIANELVERAGHAAPFPEVKPVESWTDAELSRECECGHKFGRHSNAEPHACVDCRDITCMVAPPCKAFKEKK